MLTLILSLFVSSTKAQAPLPTFSQGNLTAFPVTNQLYPRVVPANPALNGTATVNFIGTINQGVNYTQVRVKVLRDDDGNGPGGYILKQTLTQNISTTSSPANFSLSHQLPAELFDYRYELYGFNGTEILLVSADKVVAGDAYIINGQSNAEASPWCAENIDLQPNLEPNRNFVRVYGYPTSGTHSSMTKAWHVGNGVGGNNTPGFTGSWGMRLGTRIATLKGIPVCIFNGAYGAFSPYFNKITTIGQYNTYAPDDNNYWRLLRRTEEAGLKNNIRAILWWQGETDMGLPPSAIITSKADYKGFLNSMYTNWISDYPSVSRIYVFQVRLGCYNVTGDNTPADGGFFDDYYGLDIMQAQKEFADENSNVELISTNGVDQTSTGLPDCHYCYVDGYTKIADRVYRIIAQQLYGETVVPNTRSFGPLAADFTAINVGGIKTQVAIRLERPTDTYTLDELPPNGVVRNDFRLEGSGAYTITSVSISGDLLLINFSRNPGNPDPTGISYFGHSGLSEGTVINGTLAQPGGGSLYNFLNYPITFGSLPVDPLSLTVSRTGGAHQLRWKAESNERFDQFVVERGETRNSFKPIYEVYGTGQSGTIQYDFTDNKPNATVSHYRIRAIQQDGREMFSQVVTVNNRLNSVKEFRVYPNPVAGSANATINMNEAALATIHLHDASGRLLSSRKLQLQKGNNQFSLGELLDYNPGTYIVRVVTSTETQQIRVVKAK